MKMRTISLAILLLLGMSLNAQDLKVIYEVSQGTNGNNSLKVYMQSTTPDEVQVGAINFSFAHIGACSDFEPVYSLFTTEWTDFLERKMDKASISKEYENKIYDNRVQYGIAEPGMPNTEVITVPGSDQEKLFVYEMSFKGPMGDAIYMEDLSENPVNQIGGSMFNNIPYVIVNESQPTATAVEGSIGEIGQIALSVKVFPNPVTDFANVSIQGIERETLGIQVTDLKGAVLLKQNTILDEKGVGELSLNLERFARGIYNVRVFNTATGAKGNSLQVVKQ